MFTRIFTLACGLATVGFGAAAADQVAFHQTGIVGNGERPLKVSLWYPTDDETPRVVVGENPAFEGNAVIYDGIPTDGGHPLVVLSHGFGGSWRNLSWLAHALASEGYIVAAADHPGTTTFNRDPQQAAASWERPHDVSRVIDMLEADETLTGGIDATRIALVGHSLGGWTATAAAGGHASAALYEESCREGESPAVCRLVETLGLTNPEIERDMRDPRIDAFVSLDLGGATGFTPESLTAINKPFLVIGAGVNTANLPSDVESGYLAEHLPQALSKYVTIADATHFSFMQNCKPGAAAMIEEETPGDGIVCEDGGTRSRADIHSEIAGLVEDFLKVSYAGN